MSAEHLLAQWVSAKEAERQATEARRAIEDELLQNGFSVDPFKSMTKTFQHGDYSVKVTNRLIKKVDPDELQRLAAENGLIDHLSALFRWKAEVNAEAWGNAAPAITQPLTGAITTTPGRPSFAITITKKEGI